MLRDKRIANSIWMAAEKTLQIAGVFIVTAAMAKYIGPYYYGVISYYSSVLSFAYIVCAFGADPLVIKKGSINIKFGVLRAVTVSVVRTSLFAVVSMFFLVYLYLSDRDIGYVELMFFFAVFISQLLMSMDFLSLINNFTLKSKYNTISNVLGLLSALVLRYFFIYHKVSVVFFAIPILISPLLSIAFKLFLTDFEFSKISFFRYFEYRRIKVLFGILKPFAITNIFANFYLKLPILSISYFLGYSYVGVYSCASTIAATWVFLPMSIVSSFIPRYYSLSKEQSIDYITGLLSLIIAVCFFSSLFIYSLSGFLIGFLYGVKYHLANDIIFPILLSSSLSVIGTVLYHFLIKQKAYDFIMRRTLLCAVLSVPITLFLTYFYGMYGAVFSLLIIELFSIIICNAFYGDYIMMKIILNSFIPKNIYLIKKK